MNVLGRFFLNSRKERRKDRVFCEMQIVEELMFLINYLKFNRKNLVQSCVKIKVVKSLEI